LSFSPFFSFEFDHKNCCDFIGEDGGPNLSGRNPLIIAFGGNAGVLSELQPKTKTISAFKDAIIQIYHD